MEKTNWFRKLTRTNEEYGEYYYLYFAFNRIGGNEVIIQIDEEVDGLTYYYPKTRGDRRTGDSKYFHLPDRHYLHIVGNSNDIEALTKDARFVNSIYAEERNSLEARFSYAEDECIIDKNGEEIPEYIPQGHYAH